MDDEILSKLGKVYGLIFLFKWQAELYSGENQKVSSSLSSDPPPSDLYFARQVTNNACATQAILSILLNIGDEHMSKKTSSSSGGDDGDANSDTNGGVVLGPMLSEFKSFTSSFPPDLRGEMIGSNEQIKMAHNSFARQDAFITDNEKPRNRNQEDSDVFHFVAYVPHSASKSVYELDGLKEGPNFTGSYDEATSLDSDNSLGWLKVAQQAIQERIESYCAKEIKFNLMAIVEDKRVSLNEKLKEGSGLSDVEKSEVNVALAQEESKRMQWKIENDRRRHNYLPFCVELFKCMAKNSNSGGEDFQRMIKKAKQSHLERSQAKMMEKFKQNLNKDSS